MKLGISSDLARERLTDYARSGFVVKVGKAQITDDDGVGHRGQPPSTWKLTEKGKNSYLRLRTQKEMGIPVWQRATLHE